MSAKDSKVAIVTGGSRGIGRAVVMMLVREGYRVAFNYHTSRAAADELCAAIKEAKGECRAYPVDIRDFGAVKSWVEQVKEGFGRLDVLVNNAGILTDKALMLMTPEDWQEVIATNLNGMYNATRCCIVSFLKQKSGDVINIASVAGLVGLPRQTNYSASKGGMIAFTKALAKEVAAYGIRVNALAPGYVRTDMLSGLKENQIETLQKSVPLGRFGTPGEVAGCVRFLLSEQARYITGQVLQVDGGLAIR